MTTGALAFLVVTWTIVLGVTAWAFRELARPAKKPDGPTEGDEPREA